MRCADLDTSGKVWLHRPGSHLRAEGQHKTAHHGHQRIIATGPQAQGVLRPWLRLNVQEYPFQPREAREQMDARFLGWCLAQVSPGSRCPAPRAIQAKAKSRFSSLILTNLLTSTSFLV